MEKGRWWGLGHLLRRRVDVRLCATARGSGTNRTSLFCTKIDDPGRWQLLSLVTLCISKSVVLTPEASWWHPRSAVPQNCLCWRISIRISASTLKRAFHGYTITEKSSKWPLLFPHHSAFLFLPFCFHSETIHACTKVFSMLEKYKIKFCLLVHQTFNHNNLCLCDILIMICISIMEMRIQFCVSAPRDTGALFGRFQSHSSCRAQNGIEAGNVGSVMTQTLLLFWSWTSAVLPKRFFNKHAWETEQNWRGSSVPLFILSFPPENLCLFLRNYFRLGISEIHFCCTLPAKIT